MSHPSYSRCRRLELGIPGCARIRLLGTDGGVWERGCVRIMVSGLLITCSCQVLQPPILYQIIPARHTALIRHLRTKLAGHEIC